MSFLRKILRQSSSTPGGDKENSHTHTQHHKHSSQAGASSSSSGTSSPATPPHTTYTVRSSTNKHVAQVLPGLLLGSQEFAQDLSALNRYKVTHILNVTGEVSNAFPERFTYERVALADMPHVRLADVYDAAFAFIDAARGTGGRGGSQGGFQGGSQHSGGSQGGSPGGGCVLVHCYYGASRSAALVIAYLMRTERMRYREALAYLQMLRPEVYPNDGFDKQLREYEQRLWCSR